MGIKSYIQTVIECDICGELYIEAMRQLETKHYARSAGWVISKNVKCPACIKALKGKR